MEFSVVFLTVCASKLLLVQQYTTPNPFWDAWDVEGDQLYKPFLTGILKFFDLFAPASEHRPFILRIYDLALLELNGQWDVQLQMTVDAALFGILACMLVHFLSKGASILGRFVIVMIVAAILALPSGWENTLNGHHAGWFFFYIFSVLALWLVINEEPLGRRWTLGLGLIVAAYFSLFAGVVTAAAAIGVVAFKMICDRKASARLFGGLGLMLGLFLAGMALEPHFAGQANAAASSRTAFWESLGYALAWPHDNIAVTSFLVHLPLVILLVCLAVYRKSFSPRIGMIVALGIWTWLQAVGIAYARGAAGGPPVVRYMDILSIGVIANFAALLVLGDWFARRTSGLLAILAFSLVWMTSTGIALEKRTSLYYSDWLPAKRNAALAEDANLRAFVVTGDRSYIDNKPAVEIGYYNGAQRLSNLLTDPILRRILPSTIREPLPISWPQAPQSAFRLAGYPREFRGTDDPRVYGSYTESGSQAEGVFESAPIPAPRFPFLQFRVAGDLGQPGLSLAIVTADGRTIPVESQRVSPSGWTQIQVRAPRGPFRIVAHDETSQGWFVFSAPREMGALSFLANWLVHRAAFFLWVAYTGFLALFVLQMISLLTTTRRTALPRSTFAKAV